MDVYIGIGIVVVVLWGWIVWEIITSPLMPDEWEDEPDSDKQ